MTLLSTRGLARVCSRRPWRVLAAWGIALVLAVGAIATLLEFTTESEVTNNPESEQAYDLLDRLPPSPPEDVVNELVVVRSDSLTVDDPGFKATVTRLAGDIAQPGVVSTRDYYSTSDRSLVSPRSPRCAQHCRPPA